MAKKTLKKHFSAEEMSISFDLNALAGMMSMFANDLLFLHHHAIGEKFDTIHSITEELYKKALEHLDTLSEQAIIWKEYIGNYNFLSDALLEFYGQPCEEQKIDWSLLVHVLDDKGNTIIDALRSLSNGYTSDVKSLIDEIVLFWNKEINYKNAARKA